VSDIELAIVCDEDIIYARRQGRDFATHAGFSTSAVRLVGTAVSELARNIFLHAQRGSIRLSLINADGRSGVRIIARDEKAGTERPALGLCAIKDLFDGFEIVSSAGTGTTVTVDKWMS
jgi:serine/threonine-protein kinase RsbT